MIDEIDRAIIRVLQGNGRISNRELGQQVGLSPNATGVRVNRLLRDRVITGIHAHVDHAKLGRAIEAYVDCWLDARDPAEWAKFEEYVTSDDRVLEAVHITGKVDYRLRVVVSSPIELDELLGALRSHGGIGETDTRLILRRHVPGPTARRVTAR